MRRWMTAVMMVLAVFALAACGGGNATGNANDNHGHDHDNGHGDHHGKVQPVGESDLGDGYKLAAGMVEHAHDAKEVMFEITLTRDGKAVSDAIVTARVILADGKDAGAGGTGNWMKDAGLYDCHVGIQSEIGDGAKLSVYVRHGDKEMTAEFPLPSHQH
jgi:hypothetical protein